MCGCDIAYKSGLSRLGKNMEGTLHFLVEVILGLSLLRLAIFWFLGIGNL
ncbi:hypothetical protein [uncultured Veillonella sp.]|nr:hypothetical protein [uncultured Veillonella sp.]